MGKKGERANESQRRCGGGWSQDRLRTRWRERLFLATRADDMVVKVIRELLRRNPKVRPEMVEENVWGATTQEGDQGLTLGRTSAILSGLPESCAGFSVDRMCAGGLTAITTAASEIALGACDVAIAGGVEHMGHHPMGATVTPIPGFSPNGSYRKTLW